MPLNLTPQLNKTVVTIPENVVPSFLSIYLTYILDTEFCLQKFSVEIGQISTFYFFTIKIEIKISKALYKDRTIIKQ